MDKLINACETVEQLEELLSQDDIGTYKKYGDYKSVRKLAFERAIAIACKDLRAQLAERDAQLAVAVEVLKKA